MPHSNEFVDFLLEQMQLGGLDATELCAKRMFGGYGIYFGEQMFALVADEVLYFKVADNNRDAFNERGLPAFQYERSGKQYAMSYHEAPAEVLDEPDAMRSWADAAIDAARLASHNRNSKRRQ